jgi:putative solute:sodium symporter small subunit
MSAPGRPGGEYPSAKHEAARASAQVEGTTMPQPDKRRRHWQKNLNLSGLLLALWFIVTFVMGYFARELSFSFFGWPFSFWVAAQGALIVYVGIVAFYAFQMNRIEQELGVAEEE